MNRKRIFVAPRIKVFINNSILGWVIHPVNKRLNKALTKHCAEMAPCGCDTWRGYVFIDKDWVQDEIAESFRLSKQEVADINNGWRVTKLVDPDLFLNLVGYDAHLITW